MGADGGLSWITLKKPTPENFKKANKFFSWFNFFGYVGNIKRDESNQYLRENYDPSSIYLNYGTDQEYDGFNHFQLILDDLSNKISYAEKRRSNGSNDYWDQWPGSLDEDSTFEDLKEELITRPYGAEPEWLAVNTHKELENLKYRVDTRTYSTKSKYLIPYPWREIALCELMLQNNDGNQELWSMKISDFLDEIFKLFHSYNGELVINQHETWT